MEFKRIGLERAKMVGFSARPSRAGLWRAAAQHAGLSFSRWLRDAAEEKFAREVPHGGADWFPPDDRTLWARSARGETIYEEAVPE